MPGADRTAAQRRRREGRDSALPTGLSAAGAANIVPSFLPSSPAPRTDAADPPDVPAEPVELIAPRGPALESEILWRREVPCLAYTNAIGEWTMGKAFIDCLAPEKRRASLGP